MSKKGIKLLDTVALVDDLPERKLKRGEVGTVVEILAPDVFEVEFSDDEGQTHAEVALRADQIIAPYNQGEKLKIVAWESGFYLHLTLSLLIRGHNPSAAVFE